MDDKIEIRTLGMLEIVKAHTASNLIDNLLKQYNICLSQIYSIKVDNGANMVKTVEMIAEEQLITHLDLYENAFSENLSQMNDNESSSQIINDSLNDKEIAQANDSPISNINDSDSSEESGIYMDPRFNYQNGIYPSEYDKLQARDHLMSTWRQIQIFNKPKDNQSLIGSPVIPISSKKTRLDLYLEKESANAPIYQNIESIDMKTKINGLIYGQKLPSDQNILQYWQSKKYQDPELYTLSRVVLAAPCSQVSVERSFSALGLIVTPLRTRLDKSTLNDILLIKLNKNLLNNVIF
ncbi:unnamed protein product [Gordionus sp. m RMFG-2023]